MTTLVTGGTGFLGRFLVQELLDRGESVRVLARTYDAEIEELGAELVEGSLLDDESLTAAVRGAKRVYHLAGLVERDASRAHRMYSLHVDGTRKLLEAVDESVEKVVIASTSGTVGVSKSPDFVADDSSPYVERVVRHWPYYLSKIYAERVADEVAERRGLKVVQLRPSLLLGPNDHRESSTGDVALFLRREIPSAVPGGLSYVDARDTASAFVAAMEQAAPGEKYLLGAVNLTLAEFFAQIEEISGVPAPPSALPGNVAEAGSRLLNGVLRLVGTKPSLPTESVQMARHYWYVDSSRAKRDLGFAPRDPRRTLRDTIRFIERRMRPDRRGTSQPWEEFVDADSLR